MFRISLFLFIYLLVEIYVFLGVRTSFNTELYRKYFSYTYITISLFVLVFFLIKILNPTKSYTVPTIFSNLMLGFAFALFVSKFLVVIFLLIDDLIRIISFLTVKFTSLFNNNTEVEFNSRRSFIVNVGVIIASIPFIGLIYGVLIGRHKFKKHNHIIKSSRLPNFFDDYKIIQISDIHSGSFDSTDDIESAIEMINDEKPDLILFTGDLVNNRSDEIIPYINTFKKLKSKDGVYSVLGNHDYLMYRNWKNLEDKEISFQKLLSYQKEMNFQLLRNEHIKIKRSDEYITLLGVENWGLPPFPQFGNLEKTLEGTDDNNFKILMSHDPTHWNEKVLKEKRLIDLTLSGHTHGMQFGIELGNIKWSPVKFKYPRWAGLYKKRNRYLNVNRGLGFIGYPGRVGIWPEITILTLKKG